MIMESGSRLEHVLRVGASVRLQREEAEAAEMGAAMRMAEEQAEIDGRMKYMKERAKKMKSGAWNVMKQRKLTKFVMKNQDSVVYKKSDIRTFVDKLLVGGNPKNPSADHFYPQISIMRVSTDEYEIEIIGAGSWMPLKYTKEGVINEMMSRWKGPE